MSDNLFNLILKRLMLLEQQNRIIMKCLIGKDEEIKWHKQARELCCSAFDAINEHNAQSDV